MLGCIVRKLTYLKTIKTYDFFSLKRMFKTLQNVVRFLLSAEDPNIDLRYFEWLVESLMECIYGGILIFSVIQPLVC